VPVLAGTDAPNPGTVHGASLHRELQHLVAAGLIPGQARRGRDRAPPRCSALPTGGEIRPGLRADPVLVDGRADRCTGDTQRVAAVWKQGAHAALDTYAGLAAMRAQTDKVLAAVRELLPRLRP
jgi:hypothetical protein